MTRVSLSCSNYAGFKDDGPWFRVKTMAGQNRAPGLHDTGSAARLFHSPTENPTAPNCRAPASAFGGEQREFARKWQTRWTSATLEAFAFRGGTWIAANSHAHRQAGPPPDANSRFPPAFNPVCSWPVLVQPRVGRDDIGRYPRAFAPASRQPRNPRITSPTRGPMVTQKNALRITL